MDTKSKYLLGQQGNEPMIPLPNPGEGGPAAPGPGNGSNIPMIPLPSPGEGGPAAPGPGNGSNIPMIPLPGPGMGGPAAPGPGSNIPMIPLPGPGMGGPAAPGPSRPNGGIISGIIGTIITTHPRPNAPCKYCNNSEKYGNVRFLNAASDYNPFAVYVNEDLFVNSLNYADVTEYEKVASGYQVITVMGDTGYIFVQKPIMIPENGIITIAIINTASGLDLTVISDAPCNRPYYVSCIRACNLAFNSGSLNVVIGDQYVTFMNVMYKEVTDYKSIWPGEYSYYVSKNVSNQFPANKRTTVLLSSNINIQANINYTMYLLNWSKTMPDAIKVLIVEEH